MVSLRHKGRNTWGSKQNRERTNLSGRTGTCLPRAQSTMSQLVGTGIRKTSTLPCQELTSIFRRPQSLHLSNGWSSSYVLHAPSWDLSCHLPVNCRCLPKGSCGVLGREDWGASLTPA